MLGRGIIAPLPNPFRKLLEEVLLRQRIKEIICNKKLSDKEKVEKIAKLLHRRHINDFVIY